MKKYIILFGLVTYSSLSNGQEYQFKQPKNCRIEIILSDLYYEKPQLIGDTISISYFDNSGNKIKTIYKMDGQIILSTGFKYDSYGHLVESIDYGVLENGSSNSIDTYLDTTLITGIEKHEYENGLLILTNKFSHGNISESSIKYKYDAKKRLINKSSITYPQNYYELKSDRIDWKDKKESKLETCTYSYKYLNNKRVCIYTNTSGTNIIDTSIIQNGHVLKTIFYDSIGHPQCEDIYKYNNDLLIEYSIQGCQIDIIPDANRFVYEYDKDGSLLSEYYYQNNQLLKKDYYIRIK